MTLDGIENGLKRLSKQMQLEKDPDNILVMEASCEIQNLKAKYDGVCNELIQLRTQKEQILDALQSRCVEKMDNPDINDIKYKVGYLDCTNETIAIVNEVFGE